jgi:hypothetical protein
VVAAGPCDCSVKWGMKKAEIEQTRGLGADDRAVDRHTLGRRVCSIFRPRYGRRRATEVAFNFPKNIFSRTFPFAPVGQAAAPPWSAGSVQPAQEPSDHW